jgi:hypothetical protein
LNITRTIIGDRKVAFFYGERNAQIIIVAPTEVSQTEEPSSCVA